MATDLRRYESHPECPVYGEHREEPGTYRCMCGAIDMWHRAEPVERCEHGMIDGHAYRTDHRDPTHTAWCPGSPTLKEVPDGD